MLYSNVNNNDINNIENTNLEGSISENNQEPTLTNNQESTTNDQDANVNSKDNQDQNTNNNISPDTGVTVDGRYYNRDDWRWGDNPNWGYRPTSEFDTNSSEDHTYESCFHYPGQYIGCEHESIRHWAGGIDEEECVCHECGENGAESVCLDCECLFHDRHTPNPAVRPEGNVAEIKEYKNTTSTEVETSNVTETNNVSTLAETNVTETNNNSMEVETSNSGLNTESYSNSENNNSE